ncbi:MAG: WYL domain-containing protein [Cystobacter sp.]
MRAGVSLVEGWRTQRTGLTRVELHALAVMGVPGVREDLALDAPLRSGLMKLTASRPATQRPTLEYARQRLHLDTSFSRPAGFDLPSFWKQWCAGFARQRNRYEVTLRLTPEGVESLARMRAEDQARLAEAPATREGTRTVTLDFEREAIALAQLCPLAGDIEVLEPAALRARMADLAARLLASHSPRPVRR